MRKRIIATLCLIVVLLLIVASFWLLKGSPWKHEAARSHAIEFVIDKYNIQKDSLTVKSSTYNWGRGDFAIHLLDLATNENYFIEVNLKRNNEIYSIYDATGEVIFYNE
jgi:hypothetical protein